MAIEFATLDVGTKRDSKERLKYIFDCYKNTRPDQSNIFNDIGASYRGAMLNNTGDSRAQKSQLASDLTDILDRYLYTSVNISITYEEESVSFLIDIEATDPDGETSKLSETLIFEDN